MSLPSLPDVLAQSIAHFLATKERLALARCSRQNRLLAAAPFAWLHADPITVTVLTRVDSSNVSSGPLLRFIPISLVWSGHPTRDSAKRVSRLANRAHAVSLTTHLPTRLDEALVGQILEDPGFKRLESLTLESHTRRLIELACKLPLLTSLTLGTHLAAADVSLLSAAASLTNLSLDRPNPGKMSSVLECPKLQRLAVSLFRWVDLPSFSQGAGWQRLRELSLTPLDELAGTSADTLAVFFSCLRSLLVLSLGGQNMDPLLAQVHRIPKLRRLIIECDIWAERLPHSDDAMLSLLRSSPNLGVEWLVVLSASVQLESILRPLAKEAGFQLLRREEPPLPARQSLVRLVRST